MPKTLVIALHHAPEAANALRAAVPSPDVTILHKIIGAMSSPYRHAAAAHQKSGRGMVGALALDCGLPSWNPDEFKQTVIVSWSAGYAWVDMALDAGEDIDAWVALDSGYGAPHRGVVALARDARQGKRLYFANYTDIETKPMYASSADYLASVQKQAGAPAGLFQIDHIAHDPAAVTEARKTSNAALGAYWRGQHILALHRGPELLARALAALAARGAPAESITPA